MTELADIDVTIWNLSLHHNLCDWIINIVHNWLYNYILWDNDHFPFYYHTTIHIKIKGTEKETLWTDWHCQYYLHNYLLMCYSICWDLQQLIYPNEKIKSYWKSTKRRKTIRTCRFAIITTPTNCKKDHGWDISTIHWIRAITTARSWSFRTKSSS